MTEALKRGAVPAPSGLPSLGRARAETADVIVEDTELAGALAPAHRPAAARASRAAVVRVATGTWAADAQSGTAESGYGFLVLDGMAIRRVGIGERIGGELVGPCDLLRPWDHDGAQATLPFEANWQVLEPLRLAVLDGDWAVRMAPFPAVAVTLAARALRRSRRLANTLAISHHARLEERLLLLLQELADRYGTVRPDGVHVAVPMTHELLAQLSAARRPSVSGALTRLARGGFVSRDGRRWVLHGDPPAPPPFPSEDTAER